MASLRWFQDAGDTTRRHTKATGAPHTAREARDAHGYTANAAGSQTARGPRTKTKKRFVVRYLLCFVVTSIPCSRASVLQAPSPVKVDAVQPAEASASKRPTKPSSSQSSGVPAPPPHRKPNSLRPHGRSKSQEFGNPWTPAQVLKSRASELTEYEQGEILEYKQVHFWVREAGVLAGQQRRADCMH